MVVGNLSEFAETVVIGAGPGGYVAAIRLAQLGKEVTLVHNESLPGGVCLLRGCIPSKALIEAANFYHRLGRAADYGIEIGSAKIDWLKLLQWKDGIVEKLGKGVETLLKQNGVATLRGTAVFEDEKTLAIQTDGGLQRLSFGNAVIAVGSRPRPLPGMNFDGEIILSSDDILQLPEIPASLLVVGGGYIGLELGQVFAKLGSKVTIVEALPELLSGLEGPLVRPVKRRLEELGVEIFLKTQLESGMVQGEGVEVRLKPAEGQPFDRRFDRALVAIGRAPNSDRIQSAKAGLKLDEKGYIAVNRRQATNLPHLYAIGDVAGGIQLAHKASREGVVAAANIAGQPDAFDNQVPAVIFTDPEIAYVGMSESQAKEKGIETKTGMFGFGANARAMTLDDAEGFVKTVAEKSSGRLLGVQMVGPHVSDLIAEAGLALEMGAMAEDLRLTIHPHPTLSEALHEAAESVLGLSIHRYERRRQ
ncbi:MAG TPA: dihydrolipoyl dehydrogenase [bacterium]|nr:dihydrolipoyl dehydrogenase [bacterium]